MTERTTIEVSISADDALLLEVQRFYAAQMQLLDDGRAEQWAETFTDDGVFAADAWPEPARGRRAIAEGARKTTEDLARRGVRRRHWLGMPAITRSDGDALAVRSYALVTETPRGGQAALHVSTLCEDVLVRQGGRWLVRSRMVWRDDLAA